MFSSSSEMTTFNFIEKPKKVKTTKKTGNKNVSMDANFIHIPVKLAPYKKPKNKNFYFNELDEEDD